MQNLASLDFLIAEAVRTDGRKSVNWSCTIVGLNLHTKHTLFGYFQWSKGIKTQMISANLVTIGK